MLRFHSPLGNERCVGDSRWYRRIESELGILAGGSTGPGLGGMTPTGACPQTGESGEFRPSLDIGGVRQILLPRGIQLSANDFGRESRAKQAAVERRQFARIERPASRRKQAFQACANKRGLVGFGESDVESGFDVAVGHAAGAQLARDAETSLAARIRVDTGELEGIAGVIEITLFAEAS